MRISDWSSDVCSSDRGHGEEFARALAVETLGSNGRAVDLDVEVLVAFLAPIGCLKHERTWPDLHPELEETFRPRVAAVAAAIGDRIGIPGRELIRSEARSVGNGCVMTGRYGG